MQSLGLFVKPEKYLFMPIANNDISITLQKQVQDAISSKSPLYIHGGNSKLFYGNKVDAAPSGYQLTYRRYQL